MNCINLQQYFDREKRNTGRQDEIDLIKGFAIVFMVWDHVCRELGADISSYMGMFIDMILGGPFAAPMFMFCMGIGICYSHNSSPELMADRGIRLLLMGYGLNVIRYTIPHLISSVLTGNSDYMGSWLPQLLEVDILQFAGLAFLGIALARKAKLSNWTLFGIAILLPILGSLLKNHGTGMMVPDLLLGLFWKTQEHAYFTFFHWFAFPVVGMILGEYLLHCRDKGALYQKLTIVLLPVGVVAAILSYFMGVGFTSGFTEFYYMTPLNVFVMVCLAVIWVYVNDCWHRRLPKVKIVIFQSMSKNINRIYCIHWGIIGILSIVRALTWKERTVNLFVMSVMAFIVLIVSAVMAEHYARCKKWSKYRGKTINRREYRD